MVVRKRKRWLTGRYAAHLGGSEFTVNPAEHKGTDKAKNFLSVLGAGITIGIVLTVILVVILDMKPKEITIGGVGFEIPTVPVPQSTPQPSPTPDLWQFYVDDIKSTIPNASVTTDILKDIARKIPASVPFLAEAEVGLIPYQYTWKILDREGPVFLNVPEGGYAYIAWGYGNLATNEFSINFQGMEGNDHLVLVIGKPDDGTPADLNTLLRLSNFHAGFAGTNFAAPANGQIFENRKVVNKAWLSQQLWWASKHSSITVTIVDVSNGERFVYDVNPSNFAWTVK